jgi:hypothetical protein
MIVPSDSVEQILQVQRSMTYYLLLRLLILLFYYFEVLHFGDRMKPTPTRTKTTKLHTAVCTRFVREK